MLAIPYIFRDKQCFQSPNIARLLYQLCYCWCQFNFQDYFPPNYHQIKSRVHTKSPSSAFKPNYNRDNPKLTFLHFYKIFLPSDCVLVPYGLWRCARERFSLYRVSRNIEYIYKNGEKIRCEDIVSELSLKNFLWTLCALSCCFGITFCVSGHSFQIVSWNSFY